MAPRHNIIRPIGSRGGPTSKIDSTLGANKTTSIASRSKIKKPGTRKHRRPQSTATASSAPIFTFKRSVSPKVEVLRRKPTTASRAAHEVNDQHVDKENSHGSQLASHDDDEPPPYSEVPIVNSRKLQYTPPTSNLNTWNPLNGSLHRPSFTPTSRVTPKSVKAGSTNAKPIILDSSSEDHEDDVIRPAARSALRKRYSNATISDSDPVEVRSADDDADMPDAPIIDAGAIDPDSDDESEISVVDMEDYDKTPRLPDAKVSLLGETIRVWSEKEDKTFCIPIKHLRPYFKYDDEETIRYEVERAVTEHKRSVLKYAFDWVMARSLPALPPPEEDPDRNNERKGVSQVHGYVDLYHLAGIHDARDLQNAILDSFRARDTCDQGYFARKLIRRVYENTSANSKLRRYIVDTFVFKAQTWAGEQVSNWMRAHAQCGNVDFVKDVKEAWERTSAKGVVEDPNRKARCAYHSHFRGKKCT